MTLMQLKALEFATAAHAGQVRKYTGEPYINHPIAVAALVKSVPHTEAMICAAYLHDAVEDTCIAIEAVYEMFGAEVAEIVGALTGPESGPRAKRKAIYLNQLVGASTAAKTVKLADIIDNCSSILERDPEFAKTYLFEKAQQLDALQDGDPTLFGKAAGIIIGKALEK